MDIIIQPRQDSEGKIASHFMLLTASAEEFERLAAIILKANTSDNDFSLPHIDVKSSSGIPMRVVIERLGPPSKGN